MAESFHLLDARAQKHRFHIYPFAKVFKDAAGLYAFCSKSDSGRWSLHYIGQTHNLDDRVGAGCVIQTIVGARFRGSWAAISEERGQPFHVIVGSPPTG